MIEKERYQELLDIGYTETQIKKILEKDELTKELYERLIEEKETSTTKDKTGHIKFKNVNHQERAEKFGRVSDGDTTEYLNIALKYFNYRCALSGEIFESFGKVNNTKAKSNLSAEHIVPLCQGGDDIAPNLVPSVLQYNISKNGYNLLDWWKKQKDNSGKELYSPYRLLKIVNFMMKSIEARKQGLNIKQYEKVILIPNEIDKILKEIEKQDKEIQENEKRKLISDTKTTTQIDEDGKKILQIIPELEGNIPKQSEQQQKERYEEIRMMDIFLTDAIITLKENKELEQYDTITKQLDEMYKNVVGAIPFEVEVRNKILSILEDFGIEENKCTVANELLRNTNILKELKSKGNNESSINDIDNYLNEQIGSLRTILTEEQIQIGISNIPEILYNKETRNKIEFYITKRPNHLDEYLKGNNTAIDELIDVLIVLKQNGVKLSNIRQTSKIKDLIKNKKNARDILEELSFISSDIKDNWPIGRNLNNQKNRNIENIIKEINKVKIELTEEERKVILENESNQNRSERKTKEFVEVLKILKENNIDLSNIKQTSKIKDLIENKENFDEIIKNLSKVSKDLNEEWPIGQRLSTQKNNNIQLNEEIKNVQIELTEKERTVILEIENMQEKSIRKTKEFVQIIKVLKENSIDILNISARTTKLGDLIKNTDDANTILEKLLEISEDLNEDWPIGQRLRTQKKNIIQLKKEIENANIELTEYERKVILENENNQEKSDRKTKEFVQILKVLKENSINLADIKIVRSNLRDLLKDKKNAEQILENLSQISIDIKKKKEEWPIGKRLDTKKQTSENLKNLTKEIEDANIQLTQEERRVILQIENKQNRSKRKTKEFVQILTILKENNIDLSNIRQTSKVKDLIENERNSDEILEKLSQVSKDLNEEWPIGQRLRTQKKNNIQFIEEIKNAKIELTEKEKKVIFESENNQDRSERKTKEFVEILKILKSNGISLDIKMGNNPSKINDLLKEQPDAKKSKIITELKTVSEDIEGNWLIGVRLNTQRNNNIDKLEEEIKTLILDGTQFTESEIHILFDKRKDNIKDTLRSDEIIILMKKIVSKQKQQELLKENKEVNDEFTRTIKFTEHNLKYDEIEK